MWDLHCTSRELNPRRNNVHCIFSILISHTFLFHNYYCKHAECHHGGLFVI